MTKKWEMIHFTIQLDELSTPRKENRLISWRTKDERKNAIARTACEVLGGHSAVHVDVSGKKIFSDRGFSAPVQVATFGTCVAEAPQNVLSVPENSLLEEPQELGDAA